ncbi:Uncharacterized protein dnm_054380 [Desulfonema magnum]|uniref:Uncharacterized protein n=1 Tax=Desulfonema magnum TaxID=45655 RepID=A0A975BQ33_9BACT|nr:Uncharacterized protein dnm_054380 [Desulfonema magnum]
MRVKNQEGSLILTVKIHSEKPGFLSENIGWVPPFTQGQVLCVKGGTHPVFLPRRHEDTKSHEVSLRFLCVSVADFFG